MPRPVVYVLAGVNGSGKSSLGGRALSRAGIAWFNPDAYARELMDAFGCSFDVASGQAWQEGMRRLEDAIANGYNHAFETTLGGNSVAAKLREASASHDVAMWYCGLDCPEHHLARIGLRVSRGGHDIPESKVRQRYDTSRRNLIALLPHLAQLQAYDNSADAAPGTPIADPELLLQMEAGLITFPTDIDTLQRTPDWAKPIMGAALTLADPPR